MSAGERQGAAVVGVGEKKLTPREEQRLLDAAQLEADLERQKLQPHPDFPARLGYDERDDEGHGGVVFDHQPTPEEYEAAKFGGEVVVLSDRKREREAARRNGGHVVHVVARTS